MDGFSEVDGPFSTANELDRELGSPKAVFVDEEEVAVTVGDVMEVGRSFAPEEV